MPERGNKALEYRELAVEEKREQDRVAAWRMRLDRHARVLNLDARHANAEELRKYLTTKPPEANRTYLPYLYSLLADMHLRTLPAIPSATCESRTAAAEAYEESVRAAIDYLFAKRDCRIGKTAEALQWDDDFFGIGIGKVQWKVDYTEAAEADTIADEAMAHEMERATNENEDPSRAMIVDGDVDSIHLAVHQEGLRDLEFAGSPDVWSLYEHIQEHLNRDTVIIREWAQLSRVFGPHFVYDTDVPWEERSFEAELRSVRIKDMLRWGYRNINTTNCPPEAKEHQPAAVYEELTARVWEIHDREAGRIYVISADGPQDGLYLHQGDWPYGGIEVYVPVVFNSVGDDQVHGVPVAERLAAILDELGRVDFHIRRHIENHSDYWIGGPAIAGDPLLKAKLNDPNVKFKFAGSPEAWAYMKEHKPPALPETLLEYRSYLLDAMRREVGVDAQNIAQSFDHQISATESAHRQKSHESRKGNRQEIMADFLNRVAESMLGMYRKMATHGLPVRMSDAQENDYSVVNPAEIPEAIDVLFDIRGETEEGRVNRVAAANAYKDFCLQIADVSPTDWEDFRDWFGRRLGIQRPQRFHLAVEQQMEQGSHMGGMVPESRGGSTPIPAEPGAVPSGLGGFATQGDTDG